jgi:hypothetical protein
MSRMLVHHSGPVTDLAALHDALGCAAMAVLQAWRGDRDSASLSLTEAHAAAEGAFGPQSPGVDALGVVFDAIAQTARTAPADYPHNESGPPRCL